MKILTGVDLVNNLKIKKIIDKKSPVINEIFSEKEIEYCMKKKNYENSFGIRFAVKEAIIKATDSDILEYELNKIETINTESGKPEVKINIERLNNKIKKLLGKDNFTITISASHEDNYSIATVLIY
ncbi:MAG TPA: 4'-phosphopantetheinyl transferase superfamily protein [Spirochaetota bacterium]|nr:4'-phosphopantetheinyl transferase superfamily protein [Spirochaetota bacterium]HOL55971.1 4'-phosphopantetheinyl transferase superfamily protein [Spirochaetota bacterium]HPP03585.1 4'-phosphopantetheinyl transferase superfamily protein [Spirochaetota bacterium]